MSEGRVFWLAGDCAGCRAAPCVRLAENMRENRAASTFTQVKGMSADICKTVGLAYVGSNPTPATTQNCSSELVSAAFPSLSRKRSGQPGAFAGLRSFCRSARRADERAGGRWLRHGEYAEKLRPWMRHRRCGGCSGRKGGGPPAAGRDPRARVPLVIREGNPGLRKVTICSEPGVAVSRRTPNRCGVGEVSSIVSEGADRPVLLEGAVAVL